MPSRFREVIGSLKRGKSVSKKIRICPNCRNATLRPADSLSGWMTIDVITCDTCGYRGVAYLEVDVGDYEKMKKSEVSRKGEHGYCPYCGAENLSTVKFCKNCGASLKQSDQ